MHPHDPDTVYIVPIESDMYRCTPEGKLRVYRTRNGGESWEPLTRGLPQQNALECVLRDAMDTDALNPAGVYFGTRSGDVWGSSDGGATWATVMGGLPPVVCVKTAIVGDPSKTRMPKPAARRTAKKAPAARPKAARAKTARKPASRSATARRSGSAAKKKAARKPAGRGARTAPRKSAGKRGARRGKR